MGATHPDRMAGLVYLNSAEDPTLVWADYGLGVSSSEHEAIRKALPALMHRRSSPVDKTFQAYWDWQQRTRVRNRSVSGEQGTLVNETDRITERVSCVEETFTPRHVRDLFV